MQAAGFQSYLCPVGAIPIYESLHCADRKQVHFPKSKKKRIRAKWAKRPENFASVPWPYAIRMNGVLVCHPAMAAQIRAAVSSCR